MERFYGKTHAVGVSNEQALEYLYAWRDAAVSIADAVRAEPLRAWLTERIERRSPGSRAFRISPAPAPIATQATLLLFAEVLVSVVETESRAPGPRSFDWYQRVAHHLDLLDFVNETCAGAAVSSPELATADAEELRIHRMWARFEDARWRQERVALDDPRYPDTEHMLSYLDEILVVAANGDREAKRMWPFPKILWEREFLLERLGRLDEMAETMRRAARLEDDSFRRQTEEYIAIVKQ